MRNFQRVLIRKVSPVSCQANKLGFAAQGFIRLGFLVQNLSSVTITLSLSLTQDPLNKNEKNEMKSEMKSSGIKVINYYHYYYYHHHHHHHHYYYYNNNNNNNNNKWQRVRTGI